MTSGTRRLASYRQRCPRFCDDRTPPRRARPSAAPRMTRRRRLHRNRSRHRHRRCRRPCRVEPRLPVVPAVASSRAGRARHAGAGDTRPRTAAPEPPPLPATPVPEPPLRSRRCRRHQLRSHRLPNHRCRCCCCRLRRWSRPRRSRRCRRHHSRPFRRRPRPPARPRRRPRPLELQRVQADRAAKHHVERLHTRGRRQRAGLVGPGATRSGHLAGAQQRAGLGIRAQLQRRRGLGVDAQLNRVGAGVAEVDVPVEDVVALLAVDSTVPA
jgi:hypothetical protein